MSLLLLFGGNEGARFVASATITFDAKVALLSLPSPLAVTAAIRVGTTARVTASEWVLTSEPVVVTLGGVGALRAPVRFASVSEIHVSAAGVVPYPPIAQYALYAQNANKTSGILIHAE
jgi:hypothetical protein